MYGLLIRDIPSPRVQAAFLALRVPSVYCMNQDMNGLEEVEGRNVEYQERDLCVSSFDTAKAS